MVPVTPTLSVSALEARNWIAGYQVLPGAGEEWYARNLPASMRAALAQDADEALAAVDALREDILARRAITETMRSIRGNIAPRRRPAKGDGTDGRQ
jgi:hypothetical protein